VRKEGDRNDQIPRKAPTLATEGSHRLVQDFKGRNSFLRGGTFGGIQSLNAGQKISTETKTETKGKEYERRRKKRGFVEGLTVSSQITGKEDGSGRVG